MTKRTVVLDIEADGLLDEATQVWCAVGIDLDTSEVTEFTPENIKDLPQYLDGFDTWVGHNVMFYDSPLLEKVMGYKYKGKVYDTLVASRLLRSQLKSHGLGDWGERLGIIKPKHEDWSQYSEDMLHRCVQDARINVMVYMDLTERTSPDWDKAVSITMSFFELMAMQERYGWLMDRELMESSVSLLTHWMDRIDRIVVPTLPSVKVVGKPLKWHREAFKQCGGYKSSALKWLTDNGFDPDQRTLGGPFSPVYFRNMDLGKREEVVQYLLQSGWKPRDWNKNSDGENTSPKLNKDDPLEGLTNRASLLISKYIQCRHRRSQLEGLLKNIGPDGRLRQVISGLASTGRLRHGGIVNIPGGDSFFGKTMRKCFTSKPGYVIVGTDAAGCQNRALAGRVGNPRFTEVLVNGNKEDGTSIHQVNQSAILKGTGIHATYAEAKSLNYAFLFGASDTKLGSILRRDQQTGALLRRALLSVAPGFKELLDGLTAEWAKTAKMEGNKWGKPSYKYGKIRGIDGRPILVESEHSILNYCLQGEEAIIMQVALLFLYKACNEKGWTHGDEYGFVANVHDEFQSEVREDIAEEFAKISAEAITKAGEYFDRRCPQRGESNIGNTWADTH